MQARSIVTVDTSGGGGCGERGLVGFSCACACGKWKSAGCVGSVGCPYREENHLSLSRSHKKRAEPHQPVIIEAEFHHPCLADFSPATPLVGPCPAVNDPPTWYPLVCVENLVYSIQLGEGAYRGYSRLVRKPHRLPSRG